MDTSQKMSESVYDWLCFTVDTEEEHEDRKVPMLDICMWRQGMNIINHSFYEKDSASQKVMEYKSAMGIKTKVTTLTQEVIRRMRNTSRQATAQDSIEILMT